ncbi:OLC1v1013286C1 [Oldenlandia corymbosa var. corymbosa]|uniref:OLC1v1013286C1 n=1 Tax=Oldenlandia corymbosa var. corymbosa TaxID=529605 RepID=A0AAV1DXY1_OLDCO|nr:OLC1v1013286C1 [Oldenlandia corymbosa var. corymbosa]
MKNPNIKLASHHQFPFGLVNCITISCLIFLVYLLLSLVLDPNANQSYRALSEQHLTTTTSTTSLEHIVFGIASSKNSWLRRKEFVRLWWRPEVMRGCVFLEEKPVNLSTSLQNDTVSLPPVCISGDTSRFPYTYKLFGQRSAIRVARVVSETVALNHSNVRWFVFGDDDTFFFPENLVKTLSKYDHGLWYYIGANSEDFDANKLFSFEMAYGGAGFAISYPLAKVLAKVLDSCLERYPHVFGSDGRIQACLMELGVSLTHEPGFHQMDIRGNIFGFMAAHPIRPLVTLHHLEVPEPIFPKMTTLKSMEHLMKATKFDPLRILQQAVCYDQRSLFTISVSWGYAVQLIARDVPLPDVLRAQLTFTSWRQTPHVTLDAQGYDSDPCKRPVVFFFDGVYTSDDGIVSIYWRMDINCTYDKKIEEIRVVSEKLDLDIKQLQAPRRQCCDVLQSSANSTIHVAVRECGPEELIRMHP